jgi:putative FmdB family regulatory protein
MPTYEYKCKECGHQLEVVQSFTDDALTECPACGGPLRKVFGNIGITFKGSGFYKTDSRSKSGASKSKSESSGSDAKPESSDTSEKKSDSTSDKKSDASPSKSSADAKTA